MVLLLVIAAWSLSAVLGLALHGPRVVVDARGITIRPLWVRDRFTPWPGVAEIKMTVAKPYFHRKARVLLLTRNVSPDIPAEALGDPLGMLDLDLLRTMRRRKHPGAAQCHLAADMSRIDEPTDAILEQVARLAPGHVRVVRGEGSLA